MRYPFRFPILAVLLIAPLLSAQLTPGTDVNSSQKSGDDHECAVAVNPSNPNQVFVACNTSGPGLFAAVSNDGGVTYTHPDPADKTIADGDPGQGTPAWCDPTLAWDTFGNLFLTYINGPGNAIDTILSTNGGMTWTPLASFSGSVDQPTVVAANTSSISPVAVWVVWNQSGSMVARGAPVTGLNAVGAFGPLQPIPGTGSCSFGDIAIAPNGAVVQVCQTPVPGEGPSTILVNTDADGLGAGGFGAPVTASTTNVGGFDFIPAQNARSIDPESGLAFDNHAGSPHFGRLYLVYTDETVPENHDTDIMLRFSDDNGGTWSPAIRVNDDPAAPIRSQFLPRIAVDDTSGNILVCWHDCRGSAANTAMQEFCAMATTAGAAPVFSANVAIGDAASTSTGLGIEFGDYSGLEFVQGRAYPLWADTSNSTGNNPDISSAFDAALDRVLAAPPPPPPARFFSVHAGIARPHGVLNSVADPGWTANLDYVRMINANWATDLRLGISHFPGQALNPDADIWALSFNGRYFFNPAATIRTFANGGVGAYYVDPPGDFEGGANLGIGLNRPITPQLQIELTYNHHWVLTASPTLRYSQLQFGLLFGF